MVKNNISLAAWSQREVNSLLQSIARYTNFVLFGKWTLVLAGVFLLVLIVVMPLIGHDKSGVRIMFDKIEQGDDTPSGMVKPRFQGTDAKGQPYNVTADYATQVNDRQIDMEKMQADITLANGKWLNLSADHGMLDLNQERLELKGNVQFFYDEGYEMRTESMAVDMNARAAEGHERVTGQGPLGTLVAAGFRTGPNGEPMVFTGPVQMKINTLGSAK